MSYELPDSWFSPVPVQRTPSSPLYINKQFLNELKLLQESFNEYFQKEKTQDFDFGIISQQRDHSFYYSEDEWNKFEEKIRYFKTDRFFYPYSPDLGSGRNAIFKKYCWKGVGRNNTASRTNYSHSSGFLSIEEVITEVYFDRLLENISPDLRVPILAAFAYKDYPSSYIIRNSDIIRCSQIPARLRKQEINDIKNYLSTKFDNRPQKEWMDFCLSRIAQAMAKGFYQTSATRDNITIDGCILDNFSMDLVTQAPNPYVFQFFFEHDGTAQNIQLNNFEWIMDHERLKVISTPINYLSSAYHCLKDVYESLEIPHEKWDFYAKKLNKILKMPESFFKFEEETFTEKRSNVYQLLSAKNQSELDIDIKENQIIISIGKREHKRITKKIRNLLKVHMLEGSNNREGLALLIENFFKAEGVSEDE